MLRAECEAKPAGPARLVSGLRHTGTRYRPREHWARYRGRVVDWRHERRRPGCRYQRVVDIVRLAIRLQGTYGGLTLDDIRNDFSVERRTAERMRDAVGDAFGRLEIVETGDSKRHWRLRSDALRRLVQVSAEELAKLESAATAFERTGMAESAGMLRELATKLRSAMRPDSLARIEFSLEALLQAEGLAMRAVRNLGSTKDCSRSCARPPPPAAWSSSATSPGQPDSGAGSASGPGDPLRDRAFLVASGDRSEEPHLWRLANVSEFRVTDETFERDPDFDLERFAKRSFGTFQEDPVRVVLRFDAVAAHDASTFVFHPNQSIETNDDGSVTVRFEAGGIDEMCWHLFTWGESVTIESPLAFANASPSCATPSPPTTDYNFKPNAGFDESNMNELLDWNGLAEFSPQVRTAFDPECLAVYEAMTRSPILSALRLAPSLTQPRTVDLNQDVLETVFGSFGPDHAFRAFTPDWGIEPTEPQATRGLAYLLGRGTGNLRAARIRAFLEACRFRACRDNIVLERAEVLAEQDRSTWRFAFRRRTILCCRL